MSDTTTTEPTTTEPISAYQQEINRQRQATIDAYDTLIARLPAILATINAADVQQGTVRPATGAVVLGDWAIEISPADPDNWVPWRRPTLVHPSGMRLTFTIGMGHYPAYGDAGRLTIDGVYPRDSKGQIPSLYDKADRIHAITVALSQDDARIGRAIVKRLIVPYRAVWQRLSAKVASADDYTARSEASAQRIAREIGGQLGSRNGGSATTVYGKGITFECSGDRATLRYMPSVRVDTAIAIARLIDADKGDA